MLGHLLEINPLQWGKKRRVLGRTMARDEVCSCVPLLKEAYWQTHQHKFGLLAGDQFQSYTEPAISIKAAFSLVQRDSP